MLTSSPGLIADVQDAAINGRKENMRRAARFRERDLALQRCDGVLRLCTRELGPRQFDLDLGVDFVDLKLLPELYKPRLRCCNVRFAFLDHGLLVLARAPRCDALVE